MREHDSEPVRGLPERPPAGETVLWQGSPQWRVMARRAFHIRMVAVYLGALWLWLAASTLSGGQAGATVLWQAEMLAGNLALGLTALGLIALFCWLVQRTTIYTVTNRRIVIRFGIALPLTVNVPFAIVAGAGVTADRDGSGDIALALLPAKRVSYPIMWPHARPWKLSRAEPMLRGLPDAVRAAQVLSRALAASAAQTAPSLPNAATAGTEAVSVAAVA